MLAFSKVVASGNDFIAIDNRNQEVTRQGIDLSQFAREICQRKFSVGADGLLVIEKSKAADFKMRIFNPDGSEVDMCGNGIRAIAYLASQDGIASSVMKVETGAGIITPTVKGGLVKVKMTDPQDARFDFKLPIGKKNLKVSFINTGVPHVVCEVGEVDNFDVLGFGAKIRYHDQFVPEGTNADFIQILEKDKIKLRTYERGVEDETLACGTGACASAIIAGRGNEGENKFSMLTRSGEKLTVYFKNTSGKITEVYLEGKAKIVYRGRIY